MEVQIKKSIKPKRKLVIRKEPPKQEQAQQEQEQAQQTQNTKQEQEQKEQDTKEKNTIESYIESYIAQLSAQEKIVLNIAKEHLETSFDMEKSIGYMQWLKNKK